MSHVFMDFCLHSWKRSKMLHTVPSRFSDVVLRYLRCFTLRSTALLNSSSI